MARYRKTNAVVLGTRVGRSITRSSGMGYYPVVVYRYTVDGQDYVADRFHQNLVSVTWPAPVERTLKKFPPNTQIEVFYDTRNPQNAFVKKGFGVGVNLLLLLIMLIALGVMLQVLWSTGNLPL